MKNHITARLHRDKQRRRFSVLIVSHKSRPHSQLEPNGKKNTATHQKLTYRQTVCVHKFTTHQDAKIIRAPRQCTQAFLCVFLSQQENIKIGTVFMNLHLIEIKIFELQFAVYEYVSVVSAVLDGRKETGRGVSEEDGFKVTHPGQIATEYFNY